MASHIIFVDGKKFMWDGVDYPDGEKTSEALKKYKTDGFEVEQHEEDGKTYLYTRRVVKHVAVPNA
jgi:hypothetical protein